MTGRPDAPAGPRRGPVRLTTTVARTGLTDAPPSDVLERLARAAARLLGVPAVLVSLFDEGRQWVVGSAGVEWPAGRRELPPPTHSLCQHVVTSEAPLVVPDTTAHPLVREGLAVRESGVRAFAGVPLVTAAGETLGAFCAVDTAPRDWTGDDLEGLRDLATAAMSEVEARLALAALRASEARYRALLRHYPDGAVFLVDHDLRFLVADGAALAPAGRDPDAVVGRTLHEVLPPNQADTLAPYYQAALGGAEQTFTTAHGGRRYAGQAVPVRDEAGHVTAAMVIARDVTAQVGAEAALRESEARLRLALDVAGMVVWERDLRTDRLSDGTLPAPRPDAASGPGPVPAGVLGDYANFLAAVHPDDRERVARANADAVARVAELAVAYRITGPDRAVRWHETVGRVIAGDDGAPARVVGVSLDVTRRVALEAQLRHAQKMEAVGQLAGGVAHDFNNLLMVIAGNLEFVRTGLSPELPADHPAHADLDQIGHAAERAGTLVRQLLTFSRKQPVRPQLLRVGDVVRHAERLLRRVIGEEIVLAVEVDDADVLVRADAGQLEQVLMNLAVNARDAMLTPLHGRPGTGGTLRIEASAVTLNAADAGAGAWDDLAPGRYARLCVRDTGHGMDAATRAHVFEPFFTTKAVDVGTGLGLATVFGIVRQTGGAIRVDSAPGAGTTFIILLPVAEVDPEAGAHAVAAPPAPVASATILLVEDETPVRVTARRMLERRGYAVLEARHGADALLLWREHRAAIGAVVTDLRMPEMGGRELVARLRADTPSLAVVYVSGYADRGAAAEPGVLEAFVEKPFTADALLAALARVL